MLFYEAYFNNYSYFCATKVQKKFQIDAMKKIFNALLALCVVGLLFICWRSIQDDIDFKAEVTVRENAVKARLLQIKAAQEEYKLQHEGNYCDSLWKLVEFVQTGRIPKIVKEGVLSDEQMENHWPFISLNRCGSISCTCGAGGAGGVGCS